MIPPEYIAEWAWTNKAARVFGVCRLKNGTEIYAFTSGGQPGKGEAVDVIWIDEDIEIPGHVEEWQSRLSDVRGRLIWSAWPHDGNVAIARMRMRAKEQVDRPSPDVAEFILPFSANPYIPSDEKRKRLEGWAAAGEAVLRSRDRGESSAGLQLVFPGFNVDLHGAPRVSGPDIIEAMLSNNNWKVPKDWTRYLAVDPGHANVAAVFCAVPPPEVGKFVVQYDEVFAQRCDANALAQMIAAKSNGDIFHAFIIDAHAGRQTVMGGGKRVIEFYREAFERYGIKSRMTDCGFLPGSDDITARNMSVRNWLNVRADGTTQYRVIAATCPCTCREFGLYKQTITRDEITDKAIAKDNHCLDALAYTAAYLDPLFNYDAAYYATEHENTVVDSVLQAYESLKERFTGKKKDNSFHIGPGVAA